MRMTEVQAQALAAFVSRIRPEWNAGGIVAVLKQVATTADVHDVSCALIRLASDKTALTPGLLTQQGWWWLKHDGTKPQRRGDHTMRCPEHGGRLPCEPCRTDIKPPPEDVRAEVRAALDAAKTTHHQRDAEKAEREARKSDA